MRIRDSPTWFVALAFRNNLLGDSCEGPLLIKESILQMNVAPVEQIEWAVLLRRSHIDPC